MMIPGKAIVSCALVTLLTCCLDAYAAAPTTAPAANAKTHEIADLKMTFIRIEPGAFEMGSPADEAAREDDELLHKVRLSKPFYLQAAEVSQAQYKAIMESNPSYFKGDDLPVETVSWDEAMRFCEKLSKREGGRKFRLPTEAEWEYAAWAGRKRPVSGTGKLDDMAWHADNSGKQRLDSANIWDTDSNNYFSRLLDNGCRPRAVGTGTPNDWGVHDMQGNVSEWVADWYESKYFAQDAARLDPPGPAKSSLDSRVFRGGSWGSDPRNCRVASRDYNEPHKQSASRGYRVAMDGE